MQTIMTHNWTKLLGYELEVHHQHGANINVWVEDDELHNNADIEVLIRPTGGTYAPGWRAPVRGKYLFSADSTLHVGGAVVPLGPDQIVVNDAGWFTDGQGNTVFSGPGIAMNSGAPLDTSEPAPNTVEWTSP